MGTHASSDPPLPRYTPAAPPGLDGTGDEVAGLVAAAWDEHAATVLTRLVSITHGDRHLAEDHLVETYLRLLRHLRSGRPYPAVLRGWLLLTARRIHIDHLRLASSRAEEFRADLPTTTFDDDFDAIERRETTDDLLADLTPLQRRVMELRDFADLSTAQVADELGVTNQAVRSLRHRAVQTMREQMSEGGART